MIVKLFSFYLLWITHAPWGKDVDLIDYKNKPQCIEEHVPANPVCAVAEALILFHKRVISPADGPRSNYLPNSSQYTLDAIRKYGFCYGFLLGCDRLMRENPDAWVYPVVLTDQGLRKYDPVR
jgi:putative component of membrane protein insertase Oxa1/YidC/SpoIIIJ protein YidD